MQTTADTAVRSPANLLRHLLCSMYVCKLGSTSTLDTTRHVTPHLGSPIFLEEVSLKRGEIRNKVKLSHVQLRLLLHMYSSSSCRFEDNSLD